MIVSSIYSQGTAEQIQDVCLTNPPVLGVVDCHDGINKTGKVIRDIILGSYPLSLFKVNKEILNYQRNIKIGDRAGAVFALSQIVNEFINILQGGDSLAVWQLKSGEIGFTPDQYRSYDIAAIANFSKLKEKYGENKKIWEKHKKFLGKMRETAANVHYAVLNGDPRIKDCWFETKIPIKELDILIFFTDGLVTGLPEYVDRKILLEGLIKMSKNDGLEALVDWVRSHQKETLKDAHIRYPEISVVSVKF